MRKQSILMIFIVVASIVLNFSIWASAAPKSPSVPLWQGSGETSITIRTISGETFGFFGDLTVIHDGADGQPAELELDGWLVGYDDGSPDTETGILFLGTSENGAFLNPGVYD